MAQGDLYITSGWVRGNNSSVTIQPSGSSVICLYWFTGSGNNAQVTVKNATGHGSGTGDYDFTMLTTMTIGTGTQSPPHMPLANGKWVIDNTNHFIIKGIQTSSNYYAYRLSGIHLA